MRSGRDRCDLVGLRLVLKRGDIWDRNPCDLVGLRANCPETGGELGEIDVT